MTRTQVTLEVNEYLFLKAQAAQTGSSLSSLVRALVRERMETAAAASPHIWEMAGLVGESDFTGKDHDATLHAHPRTTGDTEPSRDGR